MRFLRYLGYVFIYLNLIKNLNEGIIDPLEIIDTAERLGRIERNFLVCMLTIAGEDGESKRMEDMYETDRDQWINKCIEYYDWVRCHKKKTTNQVEIEEFLHTNIKMMKNIEKTSKN